MTVLNLGDVPDGPVTMRVSGSEPFTFDVTGGLADVPEQYADAVLATFPGSTPNASTPAGSQDHPTNPAPFEEPI